MAKRVRRQPRVIAKGPSATTSKAIEAEWKRIWPDDTAHPILSALRQAYLVRLIALVGAAEKGPVRAELVEELREIGKFIFKPPTDFLDFSDSRSFRIEQVSAGVDYYAAPPHLAEILDAAAVETDLASDVCRLLADRLAQRGRPRSNPLRIIEATEARKVKPFKWRELAAGYCDCGKSRHDRSCQERIRQAVGALEKVLATYGIAAG